MYGKYRVVVYDKVFFKNLGFVWNKFFFLIKIIFKI